jgi:hypothetical protein
MDPNSSYSKVYHLLLNTPEGRALEIELIKACETAKIVAVTFDLQPGEKHPEAVPQFKIKFGSHDFSVRTEEAIVLHASHVVSSTACERVVDRRFGKDKQDGVSTFNCSRKVVDNGIWKSRGGHIDSFGSWASSKIGEIHRARIIETQDRLKVELRHMLHTDDFKAARHEALKGYAIDAIVHVMSDYAWLGKEVLKEALDAFICHDVLLS